MPLSMTKRTSKRSKFNRRPRARKRHLTDRVAPPRTRLRLRAFRVLHETATWLTTSLHTKSKLCFNCFHFPNSGLPRLRHETCWVARAKRKYLSVITHFVIATHDSFHKFWLFCIVDQTSTRLQLVHEWDHSNQGSGTVGKAWVLVYHCCIVKGTLRMRTERPLKDLEEKL